MYNIIIVLTPPISPPDNDFSPAALQRITNELEFHLYDKVITDLTNVRKTLTSPPLPSKKGSNSKA